MDGYAKIEPTPMGYKALSLIPRDTPMDIISFVRVRRDQPDGTADRLLHCWYQELARIRAATGAELTLMARIAFASAGDVGDWDYVINTRFPSRSVAVNYVNHPAWVDHYEMRRASIEDSPTLIVTPTGYDGISPATASDYGPPLQSPQEFPLAARLIAAAALLPQNEPVVLLNVVRLRKDRALGLTRSAYASWRLIFNAVAAELGVTSVLNHSVRTTFIGTDQGWSFVNADRYPAPEALARLLHDPRVLAASAMRAAAIEDSVTMLCKDTRI
jgi:hypothetical protein